MRQAFLGAAALFLLAASPSMSDIQPPAASANPQDDCLASGVLAISVSTGKVTVIPSKIVVEYPGTAATKREICFAWFVVEGTKAKEFEKLVLEHFENEVLDAAGRPVLKAKKKHTKDVDLISLELAGEPVWMYDGQPVTERTEHYDGTLLFKGATEPLEFDPEIILRKPSG